MMGFFSGHGWNYEPGTYRCEEGWNDTAGNSYGCKSPAEGDSDTCNEHAPKGDDE